MALTMPYAFADAFHHAAASVQAGSAGVAAELSEGEIRKVDRENGKLTIKHGELKNLGMPPMTMVFQAADKSLLDQVKPGDKIQFIAGKQNGKLIVTHILPAR
ncbi:MAG: copper-binding protein [Burkholderiaceae bacterium]